MRYLIFIFCLFMEIKGVQAQMGLLRTFCRMHYPEKIWVMSHLLVVRKTWQITTEARQAAAEMLSDVELDADANGGQVDAFRHCYWMARLTQEIGWRRAYRLGLAHEKGNRIDYDRRLLEDGALPDSVSCEMDLRNNIEGIRLAQQNPHASSDELRQLIRKAILEGKLWKIKKDADGNFLDWQDTIIPPERYIARWNNPKCLVPSN